MTFLTRAPRIDIDSKQLADVARFRDALGPGTLPLLAALFEEKGELPEPAELREALKLPGSGFTATGSHLAKAFEKKF